MYNSALVLSADPSFKCVHKQGMKTTFKMHLKHYRTKILMLRTMLMLLIISFSHVMRFSIHAMDMILTILQNQSISNRLIFRSFYHFK
jgi:hypothetical protein